MYNTHGFMYLWFLFNTLFKVEYIVQQTRTDGKKKHESVGETETRTNWGAGRCMLIGLRGGLGIKRGF